MSQPQVTPIEPALTLDMVAEHFGQWRTTRSKRGKVPAELMEQALSLVGQYPITRITQTLGLCFSQFRARCLERGLLQPADRRSTVNFVEVQTRDAEPGIFAGNPIQLALNRADGTCLQITVAEVHAATELMSQFLKG